MHYSPTFFAHNFFVSAFSTDIVSIGDGVILVQQFNEIFGQTFGAIIVT
jgi:hypothetical protein